MKDRIPDDFLLLLANDCLLPIVVVVDATSIQASAFLVQDDHSLVLSVPVDDQSN